MTFEGNEGDDDGSCVKGVLIGLVICVPIWAMLIWWLA